jgi:hypothetical protein
VYVELKPVRNPSNAWEKLVSSNLISAGALAESANVEVVYMEEFYPFLREIGHWDVIPNLENRDYHGTKKLLRN